MQHYLSIATKRLYKTAKISLQKLRMPCNKCVAKRETVLEISNQSGDSQLVEVEIAGHQSNQFALADGETWNVTIPNPLPGTLTIQLKERKKTEHCG